MKVKPKQYIKINQNRVIYLIYFININYILYFISSYFINFLLIHFLTFMPILLIFRPVMQNLLINLLLFFNIRLQFKLNENSKVRRKGVNAYILLYFFNDTFNYADDWNC